MVEDRWVHAAMRLTSIEFSFDPCKIYRDCPRAYPGMPKCALESLDVAECLQPSNGWWQRHTGVTLVRYSQIMCLRLIADETDARSVGDSHPSCNDSLAVVTMTFLYTNVELNLPHHLNYVAVLPCKCTQRIMHVKLRDKKVSPYNICCNFGNCCPILIFFRHVRQKIPAPKRE